ncbi:MAG: transcription initiation factor IIB family protein [Nitrosopumilaceae archaeon]
MLNSDFSHHCFTGIKNASIITDEERGEIFCSNCGSVIADRMTYSSNGNPVYSKDDYLSKTTTEGQSKLYFHDKGLSTKIGKNDRDFLGKVISNKMKLKFNRLRVWDSRAKRNYSERTLATGFSNLGRLKAKLGLPDPVCEKAALIFRKALEQNLIRGRSIEMVMSTAVYVACRETNTPRTIDDIAKAENMPKKNISRTYRHLVNNMPLNFKPLEPKGLVNRISASIGLSEKTKRRAINFLEEAKKERIGVGKKPAGLASAAIYLAGTLNGEKVSYSKIEQKSKTSAVTIRKIVHLFINNLNIPELRGQYHN